MLLADSFLERNGTLFQILASVILAAIAGVGGWWLRSRQRRSKTLDFQVVSDVPILSFRPDDSELRVTYLGQELDSPRLVRVRVRNTGTEVIRASEILEQYSLGVGSAWLVSAGMAEQSTPNLTTFEASAGPCTHAVRLTMNTLNSGDEFTLQLLLDTVDEADITMSGRIEGQTRTSGDISAHQKSRSRSRDRWKMLLGLILLAAGAGLTSGVRHWMGMVFVGALFFTAGMMLALDSWISSTSRKVRITDGVLHMER